MTLRQVVVLAGGLGTRVRHLHPRVAKPAIVTRGVPFVVRLLELFAAAGFHQAVLLVGHRAATVVDAVRTAPQGSLGLEVDFASDGDVPRGTGGALRAVHSLLAAEFVVVNGDTFPLYDVAALCTALGAHRCPAACVVTPAQPPAVANVALDPSGLAVTHYEKAGFPGATHVDAGMVKLRREHVDLLPDTVPLSLEHELFPRLVGRGGLGAVEAAEGFVDIGTPAGLARLEQHLARTDQSPGPARADEALRPRTP